ncbi:MAG: winged helix-turn-helix transcriptional regulator [Promethearchaeota archaeon]
MPIQLLEQEKLVLDLVREYLNKNRQFNMKKILPFIISRVRRSKANISKQGIENALKSLVQKNLIVEGSKIMNENILVNKKRREIYRFIIKHPGTHFNRILKQLNIANHVVVWHLNMLEKFNLIKKASIDNREIYFESKMNLEMVKPLYYLSNKKVELIIDYIESNPGTSKTSLSENVGIHFNTVSKYLKILEKYDIVNKKGKSRRNIYFLNHENIYLTLIKR